MADGRFALITGGAQGIGFATAKRFLELGFGGVMLLDRNGAKLRESAAKLKALGRVEAFEGDLMDVTLSSRAIGATVSAFGQLDVLVNAAGNTERCGLDDTTPEAYERLFGVNVRARALHDAGGGEGDAAGHGPAPSSMSRPCWPMAARPTSPPIRLPRPPSTRSRARSPTR